jgi:hypothetical protein
VQYIYVYERNGNATTFPSKRTRLKCGQISNEYMSTAACAWRGKDRRANAFELSSRVTDNARQREGMYRQTYTAHIKLVYFVSFPELQLCRKDSSLTAWSTRSRCHGAYRAAIPLQKTRKTPQQIKNNERTFSNKQQNKMNLITVAFNGQSSKLRQRLPLGGLTQQMAQWSSSLISANSLKTRQIHQRTASGHCSVSTITTNSQVRLKVTQGQLTTTKRCCTFACSRSQQGGG